MNFLKTTLKYIKGKIKKEKSKEWSYLIVYLQDMQPSGGFYWVLDVLNELKEVKEKVAKLRRTYKNVRIYKLNSPLSYKYIKDKIIFKNDIRKNMKKGVNK